MNVSGKVIQKVLCFLGFHDWKRQVYKFEGCNFPLYLYSVCRRCGKREVRGI